MNARRHSALHAATLSASLAGLLFIVVPCAIHPGCSIFQRRLPSESSGFLHDCSGFQWFDTADRQAKVFAYVDPNVDYSRYDRIMIEPVTVWVGPAAEMNLISRDELRDLADVFQANLHEHLAADYTIVPAPQPGTLRLRAAITEPAGSLVVLGDAQEPGRAGRMLAAHGLIAPSTRDFAQSSCFEVELLDALTGERFVAAVDLGAGRRVLKGPENNWADVDAAYENWALRIRATLKRLRDGDFPTAVR